MYNKARLNDQLSVVARFIAAAVATRRVFARRGTRVAVYFFYYFSKKKIQGSTFGLGSSSSGHSFDVPGVRQASRRDVA